jgi:hypothetical protein
MSLIRIMVPRFGWPSGLPDGSGRPGKSDLLDFGRYFPKISNSSA